MAAQQQYGQQYPSQPGQTFVAEIDSNPSGPMPTQYIQPSQPGAIELDHAPPRDHTVSPLSAQDAATAQQYSMNDRTVSPMPGQTGPMPYNPQHIQPAANPQYGGYYAQQPHGPHDPSKGAIASGVGVGQEPQPAPPYTEKGNGHGGFVVGAPVTGGDLENGGAGGQKMVNVFGKPYKKKTVIIIAVVIALVLILIIGLGAGLGSKKKKSKSRGGRGRGGSSSSSGGSGSGSGSNSDGYNPYSYDDYTYEDTDSYDSGYSDDYYSGDVCAQAATVEEAEICYQIQMEAGEASIDLVS